MIKFFLKFFPEKLKFKIKTIINSLKNLLPIAKRICPICDYNGNFYPFGRPPRIDAQCPSCHSLERHRLFYLLLLSDKILSLNDTSNKILHFAPEKCLEKFFKKYNNYITADISGNVDKLVNIENIDLPENSFDLIIVNHVFEHVNDIQAFKELNKVLKSGGLLITSVPIIYGWENTYENNNILNENEKLIHFGQHDHKRYYGSDFPNRVMNNCKLKLIKTFSLSKIQEIKYGLLKGEKIYLFQK